jgi:uncharacterized protein YecE (DUF72 family)
MPGLDMIHIGTSGWHYGHWKGPFYPEDMSTEDFLGYYADRFQTVEINNTFYQLPERETVVHWRRTVPDDFIFAVKANQYITHMKKLKDPEEPVSNFLENIQALEDKLGPILFQLPPHWNFDRERLESFLEALPQGLKYAFEFRDPSWFNDEAYALLERHNAAFCIYHLHGDLSPKRITSDLVYVRLHGPVGRYQGKYNDDELRSWSGDLSGWAEDGKDVYCYFDNDEAGYAAENAQRLMQMVAQTDSDSGD